MIIMDTMGTLLVDNITMCEVLLEILIALGLSCLKVINFNGFSVGYFEEAGSRAGTGFTIKNILYHRDYCSIVLTVAHIFIKAFKSKCSPKIL